MIIPEISGVLHKSACMHGHGEANRLFFVVLIVEKLFFSASEVA